LKNKIKKFLSNRHASVRIRAHEQQFQAREQEYQAIEQEVQEFELTERSQVLPQAVSIVHDIFAQEVHVFRAHATRSLTREKSVINCHIISVSILWN